jgi:hypothetical protein
MLMLIPGDGATTTTVITNANRTPRRKDTWEQAQKRREAAVILDNPELLMMHAQARFDVRSSSSSSSSSLSLSLSLSLAPSTNTFTQSIPGTRHYFTKLLCGYLSDDEPYSHAEAAEQHALARRERQDRRQSKDHELLQRRFLHAAAGNRAGGSGREEEEGGEEEDEDENETVSNGGVDSDIDVF